MSEIVITTRGGPVRVERRVMLTLAAWSQEPDSLSVTRAASLLSCSEAQCIEAMQVLGAQRCWVMDRWEMQHASRRWERVKGTHNLRVARAAQERRTEIARRRAEEARAREVMLREAEAERVRLRQEERRAIFEANRARKRLYDRELQRPSGTGWKSIPSEERRRRVRRMLQDLGGVVTWSWREVAERYGVPYHTAYIAWHRWQAGQNVVAMTGTRRTRCAPTTT